MEANNPTVVELIKIIKDDIFNSSTKENAKLLTDKIDEITFEFAELEKIMNSDELESTLTQYGELLVLLVKNKERLDSDVVEKAIGIMDDIKQVIKLRMDEASPKTNELDRLRDLHERVKKLEINGKNTQQAENHELIEQMKLALARIDAHQDWNFNQIKAKAVNDIEMI